MYNFQSWKICYSYNVDAYIIYRHINHKKMQISKETERIERVATGRQRSYKQIKISQIPLSFPTIIYSLITKFTVFLVLNN